MTPADRAALAERLIELAEVLEAQEMATAYAMGRAANYSGYVFIRDAAAALSAPEWDREQLAAVLRKATAASHISTESCAELPAAAGEWLNPGGLCGPCCDLLADAIIAAMEADRG